MKYMYLVFAILLLGFYSCVNNENKLNSDLLTSSDSTEIIRGVTAALDLYADANNNLDGERITGFWSKSPNMVFIVNTDLYQDWDILYQSCIDFYSSPIDSTNLVWLESTVIPLSKTTACVYGRYEMFLRAPSGEILLHTIPYFTATMIKEGESWKVLVGHESGELLNE